MVDASIPSLVRYAGLTSVAVAIGMLSALGTFQAWPGLFGSSSAGSASGAMPNSPSMSSAAQDELGSEIARRTNLGQTCVIEPHLTSTVLFQQAGDGQIVEVQFADALRRTASSEGQIRAYCL